MDLKESDGKKGEKRNGRILTMVPAHRNYKEGKTAREKTRGICIVSDGTGTDEGKPGQRGKQSMSFRGKEPGEEREREGQERMDVGLGKMSVGECKIHKCANLIARDGTRLKIQERVGKKG